MARRHVVTVPMMEVKRSAPKSPFIGWGYKQVRKTTTEATSERLLRFRSCIAGEMSGRDYANLREVQEAFRKAAKKCSGKE